MDAKAGKPSVLLALAGLACLAPPVSAQDDAAKADRARMQGAWTLNAVERDGKKEPVREQFILVIDGSKIQLRLADGDPQAVERGEFKIDATKAPKHLDWLSTLPGEGSEPRLAKCVYQITDNELTICSPGRDNGPRPQQFKTAAGDGRTITAFRRRP